MTDPLPTLTLKAAELRASGDPGTAELVDRAIAEIERLRAALAFYANPANWIDAVWEPGPEDEAAITPNAIPVDAYRACDCGDIARAALGDQP